MSYDEEIAMYEKMQQDRDMQFFNENSKIEDYYENLLSNEYHSDFVQVLKSIQHELKVFHANFVYIEKIVNFIKNDFKTEGVFPWDLTFLNLFITNTVNSMILSTYKLVLEDAKLDSRKNGGLRYLQILMNRKHLNNDESTIIIRNKLKEVKPLFKESNKLCTQNNISLLRNSKIAHYDISKQEEIEKIKIDLYIFQDIFNLSVEIFEILSLKYFERESVFNNTMIKTHSFKNFICQTALFNNPNPSAQLDIEGYFAYLRQNFISALSNN